MRISGVEFSVLAAVFALVFSHSGHSAPLVDNGSFADSGSVFVDTTGYGADDLQSAGGTMVPGWSSVPGHANDLWISPDNGYGLSSSPDNPGGYFVDLTGEGKNKPYGGLQQTIGTIAGAMYRLSFDLGASTVSDTPPPLMLGIVGGAGAAATNAAAVTASVSGVSVDASQEFALVPAGGLQWQTETLSFVADAPSTAISFLADSTSSAQFVGIDSVSVVLVSDGASTSVPEPASIAVLGAGAVGLMLMRRRTALPTLPPGP